MDPTKREGDIMKSIKTRATALAMVSLVFLSMFYLTLPVQATGVIRFRLLAVERYFDHTRMFEAVDLITELLNYPNWDNSTSDYESYIHLLSAVNDPTTLPASLQPFYRGNSTKANLQSEIVNFLGQAGEEEIVILYYCGHSYGSGLSLDYGVNQAELSSWLSSGGLPDAYVNVILDTCHSGYWINDGAGPCLLGDVNVLAACKQAQSAWCWGCHTAFTDEGLIPGFGAATDGNSDGWISLAEVFNYAAPACTAYAGKPGHNKTQEPVSWYSVCTGNIPLVQKDSLASFPDFLYPTTTHTIGSPKYIDGPNTYVTSYTALTLNAEDTGCPTSGIEFTKYRIDGGSWITYTASFDLFGYSDGAHTIEYYSKDNAGNPEPSHSFTVILDDTPPTTSLAIGTPQYIDGTDTYVTSATLFTLTATDGAGSGVASKDYRVNSGSWTSYTGTFTLSGPDGTYVIEYRSTDNVGNTETPNAETVILDNTPPTVEVIYPPDGFVYGLITIQIEATDAGSGVDYVEYSLDESTWIPTTYNSVTGYYEVDWDTTIIADGNYTIYARAYDNLGNEGSDPSPPEVTVVLLELTTSFTDSDFNPLEELEVLFNEQKSPMYKVSTNPGTIYEIIEITNIGSTVTLPNLELNVSIPTEMDFFGLGELAFQLKGTKPVHVYLNGIDVTPTGKWTQSLDELLVEQALAPGDTLTLTIHYEYAFKGNTYSASDIGGWTGEAYGFETAITSASGPSWIETLDAVIG
jgi:hypothetical protein